MESPILVFTNWARICRSFKETSARNYRPCFRENQPKRSFSIKLKRAFWARFHENWVYKFGYWYRFSAWRAGTKPYLSYWPARLPVHRRSKFPRNRFLGSVNVYKYGLWTVTYTVQCTLQCTLWYSVEKCTDSQTCAVPCCHFQKWVTPNLHCLFFFNSSKWLKLTTQGLQRQSHTTL